LTGWAAVEFFGEQACHDRRRRGGEDGAGRREPVELGEDRALHRDRLGRVLLHQIGIAKRVGEVVRDPHARERGVRVGNEPARRELAQPLADEIARALGRARSRIVERDLGARAREHDRPGAPNQARTHDGDVFVDDRHGEVPCNELRF
jgi:hypothetical protein